MGKSEAQATSVSKVDPMLLETQKQTSILNGIRWAVLMLFAWLVVIPSAYYSCTDSRG